MSTLPIFPILDTPEDTLIRWKRELENYIWNQDNVGGYNTAVDSINDLAPDGMIEAAKLGTTIIDGGYIKTELVDVDTIIATGSIIVTGGNVSDLTNDAGYTDDSVVNALAPAGLIEASKLGTTVIAGGYLQTILIKASQIYGDALTLGGAANANGTFVLKNAANETVGTIDKDGINMTADIRTGQRFILPMPIPADITEYAANRWGTVGLQFTNSPTIDSLHLPEGYIQVQDLINILGGGTVSTPRMDISSHILMLSGNDSVIQMLNSKKINFTSSDSDVVLQINGADFTLSSAAFTPTIYGSTTAGTPAYSIRAGSYYRIGSLVHCDIFIRLSAWGGMAGAIKIKDLPFAAKNVANKYVSVVLGQFTGVIFPAGYNVLQGQITPNTSEITLIFSGSNISQAYLTNADATSALDLMLSVTYEV